MDVKRLRKRIEALERELEGDPSIDEPTDDELHVLSYLEHDIRREPSGMSLRERLKRWPTVTDEEWAAIVAWAPTVGIELEEPPPAKDGDGDAGS